MYIYIYKERERERERERENADLVCGVRERDGASVVTSREAPHLGRRVRHPCVWG